MAVKVLRVEGMRDDTRTDDERRALEAAEAQPLDMTVDAVLDAARRESGFDDFGPRDFVERLGLLLGEVAADDNVWNAHKSMFVDHCTKAAVNRAADPAPLVGAPRSRGTSPSSGRST